MLATPTVSQIETDDSRVLAFRVSGPVRDADLGAMARVVDDAVEAGGEVSLILLLEGAELDESLAGLTSEAIIAGESVRWTLERYAVVGEPAAVSAAVHLFASIIRTRPRKFVTDDTSEAWAFIGAAPTGTPPGGFGHATV